MITKSTSKVLGLLTISCSLFSSQPNNWKTNAINSTSSTSILLQSRSGSVNAASSKTSAELFQQAAQKGSYIQEGKVISSPPQIRYVVFPENAIGKGKQKVEDEDQMIPKEEFESNNLENSTVPFDIDSPVGEYDFYDKSPSGSDADEGFYQKGNDIIYAQYAQQLKQMGTIPHSSDEEQEEPIDSHNEGSSAARAHYDFMDPQEEVAQIGHAIASAYTPPIVAPLLPDVPFTVMSKNMMAQLNAPSHYTALASVAQIPAQAVASNGIPQFTPQQLKRKRMILMGIVGGITVASVVAPAAYIYFGHPEMAKVYWQRLKQQITRLTARWGARTAVGAAGAGAIYARAALLKK